ncbi:trimethyltridecatetraene synthase-like [Typha latifolia]|uniref:trimethyltridecatetraene synthase-like n=1 Tax=Typha latifolia TaxID=4733 RepID=UPI003C2CE615
MELPTWLAYLATVLASILLLLKVLSNRHQRYNLPPGPNPWPVIGNLNLIGTLPHRSFHELSQKYGPLFHLRFGSFPVVVGSSVDMAKFFLKTHDAVFADRPKMAAGKYITYNYSNILWTNYGPYWRQASRLCLTELFSAKRLGSYEYIRKEEVNALVFRLFNSSGTKVLLRDYLYIASLSIVSRMVLGKKYLDESSGSILSPEEFMKMIHEFFLLNGVLNIGDFIPWLDFLDLQGYVRRMKRLSRKFDRFLEHVLDEHKKRSYEEGEDLVAKDIVNVLLQFADDPNLEVKLQREGIKAFIQDMITGGTESTSVTVEWAISELLRQPEKFAKATEELDRVVGRDRLVEEKDVHSLPYIEAVVKETMRMHPVAPMLAPHLSREDATVDGYDIPAGTRVLVNIWAIGRDPMIWDKPHEFNPERFLGSSVDVNGKDFELLPFGSGRRMCPGHNLGLKVIKASLANLLHGFAWRLPDGMKVEDLCMEETFALSTTRKMPLEVVVEPKLPSHLYEVL